MHERELKKTLKIAAGLTLCCLLLVGGWFYITKMVMMTKEIPAEVKLGDFVGDTVSARFRAPHASHFQLLLASPTTQPADLSTLRPCPLFSGTVLIRDSMGVEVDHFEISSNSVEAANWLTQHGLDSYIVTWQQNRNFQSKMIPGQVYEITVTIPSRPAGLVSAWVSYLQSGNQKKEDDVTARTGSR